MVCDTFTYDSFIRIGLFRTKKESFFVLEACDWCYLITDRVLSVVLSVACFNY
uniref:Uncharacterized protein n=1 Tax=Arundo donax TaxID=35708 RepID=A0A0A8Z8G3_ARUDO